MCLETWRFPAGDGIWVPAQSSGPPGGLVCSLTLLISPHGARPHLPDEETEVQRLPDTCPERHGQQGRSPGVTQRPRRSPGRMAYDGREGARQPRLSVKRGVGHGEAGLALSGCGALNERHHLLGPGSVDRVESAPRQQWGTPGKGCPRCPHGTPQDGEGLPGLPSCHQGLCPVGPEWSLRLEDPETPQAHQEMDR